MKKPMRPKVKEKEPEMQKMLKETPKEPMMDFDTWFAVRQGDIPDHHRKEVLKADFKARGLKHQETLEIFDMALKLYGVNI